MDTKDVFKSRTVNLAWAIPLLIDAAQKFIGIEITASEAGAIMGGLMIIMRLMTGKAIGG